MRIFILLGAALLAWLASLLTKPLLSTKISKFNLFFLNFVLGGALIIFIVVYFNITEELAVEAVVPLAVILAIIVTLTNITGSSENLKTWYQAPEEEDDKEYFSKKDMRGKPWWAFLFIFGWITLIGFNLLFLSGLVFWIFTGDIGAFLIGLSVALIMDIPIIRTALKRKRDYDNDYK